MTKIYVTKYALTEGVMVKEADVSQDGKMASISGKHCSQYFHGKDFHLDIDSAIKRAEEMRIKKLQSLDKMIKKISGIRFDLDIE